MYICHNIRQHKILDFMNAEFPMYAWSKITLSRRLEFFGIKYVDYGTTVDEVKKAVEVEMEGPGILLG